MGLEFRVESLDARHKTQDTRYKIQDTRHKSKDAINKTQESAGIDLGIAFLEIPYSVVCGSAEYSGLIALYENIDC